jgi:hypothetical protein
VAAANGHLAAALDQVDALVAKVDESPDEVRQGHLVTRAQAHRLHVADVRHNRLQDRSDRGDEYVDRERERVVVIGMGEPAHDPHASADGVRRWRQPLVREGLPRREDVDLGVGEQPVDRGGEVLGLPAGPVVGVPATGRPSTEPR